MVSLNQIVIFVLVISSKSYFACAGKKNIEEEEYGVKFASDCEGKKFNVKL